MACHACMAGARPRHFLSDVYNEGHLYVIDDSRPPASLHAPELQSGHILVQSCVAVF